MLARIIIALVASGLLLLSVPQPVVPSRQGAIPQPSRSIDLRSALPQSLQSLASRGAPISAAQSQENSLISFSRDLPAQVQAGQTFTVKETLTAKTALELAAIADILPTGFTLSSGSLIAFKQGLKSGDTLTNSYQLTAPSQAGTLVISGKARAKPSGAQSQVIALNSPVTVLPPNLPPVANFSITPSPARAGQKLTFNAGSSRDPDGSIADYRWNFGDGTLLNGPDKISVQHTYQQMNTYTVTLTVTDNKGATTAKSVTVNVGKPLSIFEQLGVSPAVAVGAAMAVGVVLTAIVFNRQITALFCVDFGLFCPRDPANPLANAQALPAEQSYPQVAQAAQRYIAANDLGITELISIERFEQVNALNRARLTRLLTRQARLMATAETALQLNLSASSSPVRLSAGQVATGDTVLRLNWQAQGGNSFSSFALVDPAGRLIFDSLMGFAPLSSPAALAR
ncbi:MAG TPA: PKD domain-containing protein [Candidatus Fraserbacteria bacterium]|nr:PKD domain-containing protein [Candidatus Fraserbacteria bacterium]